MERDKKVYRVTILGSVVNLLLLVFKFVAGVLGHSAAMIADAVHSLSDFVTDLIVIVFVKISSKPEDADHAYGHGKYETLASCIIGLALIVVGVMMGYNATVKIVDVVRNGTELASPGIIALAAAVLSIVLKEWMFHITRKVAREVDSPAVEANAWHHRSDALSSVGTAIGIGGAVLLGSKWAVLDPIAALVVRSCAGQSRCAPVQQSRSWRSHGLVADDPAVRKRVPSCRDALVRHGRALLSRRRGSHAFASDEAHGA